MGQCNLDQLNYPEYRGLVRSGLVYSQCARWRGGQRVGTLAERKRMREGGRERKTARQRGTGIKRVGGWVGRKS